MAIVDLATGELIGERFRKDTPQPATPGGRSRHGRLVAANFDYKGPFGVDFPGVVLGGVVQTAANVDPSWKGTSLVDVMTPKLPGPVTALTTPTRPAWPKRRYGAGRGHDGVVIMVTFGTGIGIAIIHNGQLIPNSELGHIELDGHDAETKAAASAREREGLSWEQWCKRASKYLSALENLMWPELFILGGGISKKSDKWVPLLKCRTPLKVAQLINNAGIVGAALAAHEANAT